jgi:hypothetical protein
LADHEADASNGGEGALWRYLLNPLRAALQLGGGAVALVGLLAAAARVIRMSEELVFQTWGVGAVALLAAVVKRGYPLPPIGARAAVARVAGTLLLGSWVAGLVIWLAVQLGLDPGHGMASASAFIVLGVVVAALGRYPRIEAEGPLVTAAEIAAADDALVACIVTLLCMITVLFGHGWRVVVELIGVVETIHPVSRVVFGALAGFAPLVLVGLFMFGRRGRSPIGRSMGFVALPVIAGVIIVYVDVLSASAAELEAATMIDARVGLLAGTFRQATGTWAAALLVGGLTALTLAVASGLRARTHGLMHDIDERRHYALVAPLTLVAALVPVLMASPVGGHVASGRVVLLGAAFATIGVAAVHIGAAAIGGPMTPLQSRASGYVTTAGIAGTVAVLLYAVAMSLSAGTFVSSVSAAPLAWPSVIEELRDLQRAHLLLLLFTLPVVVAVVLSIRDRWRVALRAASRHFGWGALLLSVTLTMMAMWMPVLHAAVTGAWIDAKPAGFELVAAQRSVGICADLDASGVVFVDAERITQDGRNIAPASRLDDVVGCTTVAASLETAGGEVVLALAPTVPFARATCLLLALASAGDEAPLCRVRLLARDSAHVHEVPQCAVIGVVGGDCGAEDAVAMAYQTPGEVQVDTGVDVVRFRWPEERYRVHAGPAAPGASGTPIGVAVRGDTPSSAAVDLFHELRAYPRTARKLSLVLPIVARERAVGPSVLPTYTTVQVAARSSDPALATQLAKLLEGQVDALARCHHDEAEPDRERTDAQYRLVVARDGSLVGVWRGASRGVAAGGEQCTAQLLAGMRLSPRSSETLVKVGIVLRTEIPTIVIGLAVQNVELTHIAAQQIERTLAPGKLDACYRAALTVDPSVHGSLWLRVGPNEDDGLDVNAQPSDFDPQLVQCVEETVAEGQWPPIDALSVTIDVRMVLPGPAPSHRPATGQHTRVDRNPRNTPPKPPPSAPRDPGF